MEDSETILIDCVVSSNPNIIINLEWFKDKYLLSNSNKYQILPNNSLLIRNIQKADRGNYYCACNNTIKKAVSAMVSLQIVSSKQQNFLNINAHAYGSIKIECQLAKNKDFDKSQIKWFKVNIFI